MHDPAIEILPIDMDGSETPPPAERPRPSPLVVANALVVAVAVLAAALAWQMRGERDAARRGALAARGESRIAELRARELSDELGAARSPNRSSYTMESFGMTFGGRNGGYVNLVFVHNGPVRVTMIAHVDGEPADAVFDIALGRCAAPSSPRNWQLGRGGPSSLTTAVDLGTLDPDDRDVFVAATESFPTDPPRARPVMLGGVRGPFFGSTPPVRVPRGANACA